MLLFHATVNTTWPPDDDYVHVGTRAAAEQRMNDFNDAYHDPELSGTSTEDARWKVHQVRTTGLVYPHVITDQQANDISAVGDPSILEEDGLPSGAGYCVFRYANHHEDKGQMSVLVHGSHVRVVSTETTGQGITRHLSPAPA